MIRPAAALVSSAALLGLTALAPTASAAPGNLLKNPGFERSQTSNVWKGEDCCVTTSDPHGGSWIAWMGGTGTSHTDKISQKVSIPDASGATLSFWLKISTQEGDTADDTFRVRVTKADGTSRTIKTLSSADATGDTTGGTGAVYVKHTAGMDRYTDKTVVVAFIATEDLGGRTDFQLDDTALKTQS